MSYRIDCPGFAAGDNDGLTEVNVIKLEQKNAKN